MHELIGPFIPHLMPSENSFPSREMLIEIGVDATERLNERLEKLKESNFTEAEIEFVFSLYSDGLFEGWKSLCTIASSWYYNFATGSQFSQRDIDHISLYCETLATKFNSSRWPNIDENEITDHLEVINAFHATQYIGGANDKLTSKDVLERIKTSLTMLEFLPSLLPTVDNKNSILIALTMLSIQSSKSNPSYHDNLNCMKFLQFLSENKFPDEQHPERDRMAPIFSKIIFNSLQIIFIAINKQTLSDLKRRIQTLSGVDMESIPPDSYAAFSTRPVLQLRANEGPHATNWFEINHTSLFYFLQHPDEGNNAFSQNIDTGLDRHIDAFQGNAQHIKAYLELLNSIAKLKDNEIDIKVKYTLNNPLFYEKNDNGETPIGIIINLVAKKRFDSARTLILNFEELISTNDFNFVAEQFTQISANEQLQIKAIMRIVNDNSDTLRQLWGKIVEFNLSNNHSVLKQFEKCIPDDASAIINLTNQKSVLSYLQRNQTPQGGIKEPDKPHIISHTIPSYLEKIPHKIRPLFKLGERSGVDSDLLEKVLSDQSLVPGLYLLVNDIHLRSLFFERLKVNSTETVDLLRAVIDIDEGNIYKNMRAWLMSGDETNSAPNPEEEEETRNNYLSTHRLASNLDLPHFSRIIVFSGKLRENTPMRDKAIRQGEPCFQFEIVEAPLTGTLPDKIKHSDKDTLVIADIGSIRHSQFYQLQEMRMSGNLECVYIRSSGSQLIGLLKYLTLRKQSLN